MSSLAAVQADGFYHRSDYDPRRHGTLNKIRGSHHLGARAKRLNEGILVIRFEMPFKLWCGGCGTLVDKGVRFNADKKAVGEFHSTTIWEFSMKCYHCDTRYVIRTDPENASYLCISGCRKKMEDYKSEFHFRTQEELIEIQNDTLLRVEIQEADSLKGRQHNQSLAELIDISDNRGANDYEINKKLRRKAKLEEPRNIKKKAIIKPNKQALASHLRKQFGK